MIWTQEQCESQAKELLYASKSYDWALNLIRMSRSLGERPSHRIETWLKRLASSSQPNFEFRTSSGLRLIGDFRDRYSRNAALHPDDEMPLADRISQALRQKPGCFVDVGCNMGIVSALVAQANPDREIWAVEPDPHTARRAAGVFVLNNLAHVTLVQAACTDQRGIIEFFTDFRKSESSSVIPQQGKRVQKVEVEAIEVDSLPLSGPVSCIKFDVEGHEPEAVRGATEVIRRDLPTVLFEYHWGIAPSLGWTAESVMAQIAGCGPYRFWLMGDPDIRLTEPTTRDMGTVLNIIATPEG